MKEKLIIINNGEAKLSKIGDVKYLYKDCKRLSNAQIMSLFVVNSNKKSLKQQLTKKKKNRRRKFRKGRSKTKKRR
jgi:hypothetical protein